jgi:hypothetical protein
MEEMIGERKMVGKKVSCLVRSAHEDRLIRGKVIAQCQNKNVYVLQLDHSVDFLGSKYSYRKHDTILVSQSEILN